MSRRLLIGTGYHGASNVCGMPAEDFAEIWHRNTLNATMMEQDCRYLCVGDSGNYPGWVSGHIEEQLVHITGDLGHIRDKADGKKNHALTGWAAGMLTAAMVAYTDERDFIYKEQDCLAWGNWIDRLYADLDGGIAAFGRGLRPPHQKLLSTQSLFIVKHEAIWRFVCHYLELGEDVNSNSARHGCFGECKFWRMHQRFPNAYHIQSADWNIDRDRPIPYEQRPLAAQQFTEQEMAELKQKGMI